MEIFLLVLGLVCAIGGAACVLKYLNKGFGKNMDWMLLPIVIVWLGGIVLTLRIGVPLVEALFSNLRNCTWRPGRIERFLGILVGSVLTGGSFVAMLAYLHGRFGTGLPRAFLIVICLMIGLALVIFLGVPLTGI